MISTRKTESIIHQGIPIFPEKYRDPRSPFSTPEKDDNLHSLIDLYT